jgi:hypothetical protein
MDVGQTRKGDEAERTLGPAARHDVHVTAVTQIQKTHCTITVRENGIVVVQVSPLFDGRARLPVGRRK